MLYMQSTVHLHHVLLRMDYFSVFTIPQAFCFHQASRKSLMSNTDCLVMQMQTWSYMMLPKAVTVTLATYCAIQPSQLSFIPHRDTSSCLGLLRLRAHKALRMCLMSATACGHVPCGRPWYVEAMEAPSGYPDVPPSRPSAAAGRDLQRSCASSRRHASSPTGMAAADPVVGLKCGGSRLENACLYC